MNLHHVAIATRDPEKLAQFYESVLGLERERAWPADDGSVRSVWLKMGGARLMLERCEAGEVFVQDDFARKAPGFHLLAFRIAADERETWRARLGDRVVAHTGFTLYIRDPDGNRIGVSHYPDAA